MKELVEFSKALVEMPLAALVTLIVLGKLCTLGVCNLHNRQDRQGAPKWKLGSGSAFRRVGLTITASDLFRGKTAEKARITSQRQWP
jgi:hypothetical protein